MRAPDFSQWLNLEPYGMEASKKSALLAGALRELTRWHAAKCQAYQRILALQGADSEAMTTLEQVPYLPARLFKEFDLLSIDRSEVFKTMTSSGTTESQVSKIYLDRATASFQTKVLSRLMSRQLGKQRLPMLVVDSPGTVKERWAFSARGAAILGFSLYGQDVTYALSTSMKLDVPAVEAFLDRHRDTPIFIFGFTFMLWLHWALPLQQLGKVLPIHSGIILHGGGWKKLEDQGVDNETFRVALQSCVGGMKVVNYYGMVEQTGALFMECEEGWLHAPVYADVIIRDPYTFGVAGIGQEGIIEVLSVVPLSYPGHALLTEDVGVLLGEDDCACGRLGKYFRVIGRVPKAEARGCSDTYEART
ncbi:MAG: acyl-protein synthetase [Nitrospira sp. UW-LDO-01]|nr:MAG: acyl-protein synthetase [Nitrospira sp. UW-LDO-01]